MGAGEILITSIDRDGTIMIGYDLELTRLVCASVSTPVIASGGAGTMNIWRRCCGKGRSLLFLPLLFSILPSKRRWKPNVIWKDKGSGYGYD